MFPDGKFLRINMLDDTFQRKRIRKYALYPG